MTTLKPEVQFHPKINGFGVRKGIPRRWVRSPASPLGLWGPTSLGVLGSLAQRALQDLVSCFAGSARSLCCARPHTNPVAEPEPQGPDSQTGMFFKARCL